MKIFKDQAFRQEFPVQVALDQCGRGDWLMDSCRVARLDEKAISDLHIAEEDIAEGSVVGIDSQSRAFLFSKSNDLLGEVKGSYWFTSNYAYTDPREEIGETLAETIDRLGCQESLSLVVQVKMDYKVIDHYSEKSLDVVVYKLPKGESITLIIQRMKEAEVEAVKLQAAF